MKQKILYAVLLAVLSIQLYAQKAPMRIGKVDIEDLKMEYFPSDSTADLAILCEYGYWNNSTNMFQHLQRIKVLSKEGLDNLIFKIGVESKSDVRGFVLNYEDGDVVKEKIKKEHVFIERSGGSSRVRVAPPNVKVGSVIDLEYSYQGYPEYWQFQRTYPVRYSEFYMPQSTVLSFRYQQMGFEYIRTEDHGHYIGSHLPAFKAESFINSIDNYLSTVTVDLSEVHAANSYAMVYESIAGSWADVNKIATDHDGFYGRLSNPYFFLNDAISWIEGKASNTREKVELALQVLHKNVSWDDISDLIPASSLKDVWEEGSGTSSDMNFLFMIMLRKMDIDCEPVLMSSRSRGIINPYFPTLSRFNYMVSAVQLEGENIVVDASDKYTPLGYLTNRSNNQNGFMISSKSNGEWLQILPEHADSEVISANINIDTEGTLSGEFSIRSNDYAAISIRREIESYSSEDEYLEDMESDFQGLYIEDYQSNIEDSDFGQVTEIVKFEFEDYATVVGDMITFNPIFIERWEENPFKLEDRKYPVDFGTPIQEMYVFNYSIPEGYVVEQVPEPISMVTQSKDITFQYISNQVGNTLQVMVKLLIKKPVFLQSEYQELKMLFNLLVQKEQESIILKKAS